MCGSVRWKHTERMINSQNAENVSLWHGAEDVRLWQMEQMEIFTVQIPNAGKQRMN